MNQPIDSTFIPFPTPSGAAPHAAGAHDITASGANRTAHRAVATTAGGGRGGAGGGAGLEEDSPDAGVRRGRPHGCSDRVVAMMKGLIRQHGFSDTAAAEGVGVSSTTISRWKKEDPELAAELLKTRFECRIHHLEIVENAAAAENGRGWRASTWMLERLFPGDYSPKMKERFAYMNLQEKIQYREESDLVYDDVKIRLAKEKAQRAQAAAEAAEAELQEARAREGAGAAGSRAAGVGGEPAPCEDEATPPPAEASCIYSEGASRNSRNSEETEPGSVEEAASSEGRTASFKEPGRPRPHNPTREAARKETRDEDGADEHIGQSAASPFGSTGRGRPDSLKEAAPSSIHSEGDSRNSRNCPAPTQAARPDGDRALPSKVAGASKNPLHSL